MDMNDVKGQEHIKRGMEVAAAGNHSILLIGPPKSGKTMLAKRFSTITDKAVTIIKDISYLTRKTEESLLSLSSKIIVSTMHPCPCGYFTDPKKECNCTPYQIQRYLSKISGQLLDKTDLYLNVPRLNYKDLSNSRFGEKSEVIKKRVEEAKMIQKKRYSLDNANLPSIFIEKYCIMNKEGKELLKMAILELGISARAYDKILKVARTIADLDKKKIIEASHISEAISYRSLDRDFWM